MSRSKSKASSDQGVARHKQEVKVAVTVTQEQAVEELGKSVLALQIGKKPSKPLKQVSSPAANTAPPISFVTERMGDKDVREVPGIGDTFSQRLRDAGFGKASQLYGQYLVLNRDKQRFRQWLNQVNVSRMEATFEAFEEYFKTH